MNDWLSWRRKPWSLMIDHIVWLIIYLLVEQENLVYSFGSWSNESIIVETLPQWREKEKTKIFLRTFLWFHRTQLLNIDGFSLLQCTTRILRWWYFARVDTMTRKVRNNYRKRLFIFYSNVLPVLMRKEVHWFDYLLRCECLRQDKVKSWKKYPDFFF